MGTIMPFGFDGRQVRTTILDDDTDQIWFVAVDVANVLEYRNAPDMTRGLDDDEKGTHIVRTPGGDQRLSMINESGLYHAIFRSRKAEAQRFRKWVTSEVLPAVRKNGRYEAVTETPAPNPRGLPEGVHLTPGREETEIWTWFCEGDRVWFMGTTPAGPPQLQ